MIQSQRRLSGCTLGERETTLVNKTSSTNVEESPSRQAFFTLASFAYPPLCIVPTLKQIITFYVVIFLSMNWSSTWNLVTWWLIGRGRQAVGEPLHLATQLPCTLTKLIFSFHFWDFLTWILTRKVTHKSKTILLFYILIVGGPVSSVLADLFSVLRLSSSRRKILWRGLHHLQYHRISLSLVQSSVHSPRLNKRIKHLRQFSTYGPQQR